MTIDQVSWEWGGWLFYFESPLRPSQWLLWSIMLGSDYLFAYRPFSADYRGLDHYRPLGRWLVGGQRPIFKHFNLDKIFVCLVAQIVLWIGIYI